MEIKIDKKFFISIGIVIVLCFASFCAGRFFRIRGASDDGYRAEQQIEQLQGQLESLDAELQLRIEECEQLQGQLDTVGLGIDESIRVAGSIRDEIESSRNQLTGSSAIVQELRKRITQYEDRIRELEESLRELKEGLNQ